MALKGNVSAATELADRVEGRPRQAISVGREEDYVDTYNIIERLVGRGARALAAGEAEGSSEAVAKTLLSNDLEGFSQEAWPHIGERSPFIGHKQPGTGMFIATSKRRRARTVGSLLPKTMDRRGPSGKCLLRRPSVDQPTEAHESGMQHKQVE
jgi:hypothetical protein